MREYNPPPHREFPGLLPATEENINRLLAGARQRRRQRERRRKVMFVGAMLILFIILVFVLA